MSNRITRWIKRHLTGPGSKPAAPKTEPAVPAAPPEEENTLLKEMQERYGNTDRRHVWAFCAGNTSQDFRGNPKYLFVYINRYRPDIKAYWFCETQETLDQVRALGFEAYDFSLPETRYVIRHTGVLVTEQKRVFEALRDPSLSDEERAKLNRPIRVCGVVKNTGEPGGGPFLVREADGSISYQILESSQISDPELMKQSTHFNPVDLVCAIRDYEGKPFDLPSFVDPQTGFISNKSKDGKELLALELPGLWNGAMSRWNTIFVEVPVSTFNPVKTVNDLLRPEHQ